MIRSFRRGIRAAGRWMAMMVAAGLAVTVADAAACELRVGWTAWTPYTDRADDGTVVGIDAEAIRAVAARAGCSVRLEEGEWSRLLYEIEHGRLDALPGASYTEERARYAWFSQPYRKEAQRLFVRAGDGAALAVGALDIFVTGGRTLGVVKDNYFGPAVARMMADPATAGNFEVSQSSYQDLEKMVHGRLDGVIVDHASGIIGARKLGLRDKVAVHPMAVHATDVHLMLSRAAVAADLATRIDAAIAELAAAGTFADIERKYLGP